MRHLTLSQDGPINTLALNKDCNKVVVAGRNIFRVCEIKYNGFAELHKIQTGKNSNLNFSCNDATWNPVDEQWLATAATNGAVVLWNMAKCIKQETVYYDHKRTVNKVAFHGSEMNMLLSGSQDGTMKYFDIRMKTASMTFVSNAESVRDVQFNPHQYFGFAAVSENGTVQLWDLRRQDRCEKQFTAHSGPIFACDWHPEVKTWLATAGRDRAVKVWDLGFRPVLEHTVTTMASVGRIKWRPQKKHHIASCALVIDSSIHVWDIRRPYIPLASFNDHKDITTAIVWRGSPDILLSASKDSYLIQHVFADAERPTEKANPVCVSYNSSGSLAFAKQTGKAEKSTKSSSSVSTVRKVKESDDFPVIRCSIQVFENHQPSPATVFQVCAEKYLVSGKSLSEMCDHNAAVAWNLGRHQTATTWSMVKLLFAYSGSDVSAAVGAAVTASRSVMTAVQREDSDSVPTDSRPGTRHQSGNSYPMTNNTDSTNSLVGTNSIAQSNDRGDTSGGVSEEAESEVEDIDSQERTLSHIASRFHFNTSDFMFGDSETDVLNDYDVESTSTFGVNGVSNDVEPNQNDWVLPHEAFQPRHEIKDRSPPPEHFQSQRCFADHKLETQTVQVEDQTSALLCLPGTHGTCSWNGTSNVVDMIYHLAEEGDVQTVVTLILILGDRIRNLLNDASAEHWFLSYIDTLHRFRLWNTAALVIKLSPYSSIQRMSHRSTNYCTNCPACRQRTIRSGWMCDHCKNVTNTCSLCHLVVRGLYVWCRGCSHGGHLVHMQEWFTTNDACPTGCGHVCEFD